MRIAFLIQLNENAKSGLYYSINSKIQSFKRNNPDVETVVYNIEDLIEFQNEENIKSAGKLRQEGKDYIVNDGDIIFFKFNV